MPAFSDSAFTFSSDSNSLVEPPVKRPRHTNSKWQDNRTFVLYTVCRDFSVGEGGVHEVKRHCSIYAVINKTNDL